MKEGENRPQPGENQTLHEGGQTSLGLPSKPKDQAIPNLESTLSRAVERTRELYERNGWVFLPLGEGGEGNASSANSVTAESREAGLKDKSPITDPPKRRWRRGAL
jgi:hypothetical protein